MLGSDRREQYLHRAEEPGPGTPTYPGPEDVWCPEPGGSSQHIVQQETGKVWDAVLSDRDLHLEVHAIQGCTWEDGFAIPVKSLTERERGALGGPALKGAAAQCLGGRQGSGRPEHRGLCLPAGVDRAVVGSRELRGQMPRVSPAATWAPHAGPAGHPEPASESPLLSSQLPLHPASLFTRAQPPPTASRNRGQRGLDAGPPTRQPAGGLVPELGSLDSIA